MFARPRELNIVLAELETQGTSGLPVLHVGPKSVVYSRADAFWRLLDDTNMSELLFGHESFENITRDTFVGEAIVPHLELVRAALLGDSTLVGNRQIMTILNRGFHKSPISAPVVSAVLHTPLHSEIPFPHTLGKLKIVTPQATGPLRPEALSSSLGRTSSGPLRPEAPPSGIAGGDDVPGKLVSLWGFF